MRKISWYIRINNMIKFFSFQLKTQFDRNVVTHFEAQEQVFDYTFSRLGINTEGSVNHPIVMTEAFVNPNYCRQCKSMNFIKKIIVGSLLCYWSRAATEKEHKLTCFKFSAFTVKVYFYVTDVSN